MMTRNGTVGALDLMAIKKARESSRFHVDVTVLDQIERIQLKDPDALVKTVQILNRVRSRLLADMKNANSSSIFEESVYGLDEVRKLQKKVIRDIRVASNESSVNE